MIFTHLPHPADDLLRNDTDAVLSLALQPVLCIDCDKSVPLGWVDRTDTPKCPAKEYRYTHRVRKDTITHLKDRLFNSRQVATGTGS